MEAEKPERKWYKKKRYLIPLGIGSLLFVGALSSSNSATQPTPQSLLQQTNTVQQQTQTPAVNIAPVEQQNTTAPKQTITPPQQTQKPVTTEPSLSNDNTYTNVDGNTVHSPAYTSDDSVPAGASARCRDGTYSFSQNRRGTCSHHGGVAEWY